MTFGHITEEGNRIELEIQGSGSQAVIFCLPNSEMSTCFYNAMAAEPHLMSQIQIVRVTQSYMDTHTEGTDYRKIASTEKQAEDMCQAFQALCEQTGLKAAPKAFYAHSAFGPLAALCAKHAGEKSVALLDGTPDCFNDARVKEADDFLAKKDLDDKTRSLAESLKHVGDDLREKFSNATSDEERAALNLTGNYGLFVIADAPLVLEYLTPESVARLGKLFGLNVECTYIGAEWIINISPASDTSLTPHRFNFCYMQLFEAGLGPDSVYAKPATAADYYDGVKVRAICGEHDPWATEAHWKDMALLTDTPENIVSIPASGGHYRFVVEPHLDNREILELYIGCINTALGLSISCQHAATEETGNDKSHTLTA